jgi:hypothetical protein
MTYVKTTTRIDCLLYLYSCEVSIAAVVIYKARKAELAGS